jgi:EAL domain-containing protein (putative c-di-GMP-specific phosphodiesterase class I)
MAPVICINPRRPAPVPLSMAFQPIVDVAGDRIVAYEALVRGAGRESAKTVRERNAGDNPARFDQECRVAAIEWAAKLGLMQTRADLCINFSPNSAYQTASSLKNTCEVARRVGIPLDRIVLEITEMEKLHDHEHLRELIREFRHEGLRTAIDDFGAGYAGLTMLAAFQPDIIKIDLELTKKIHERHASRVIVRSIVQVCGELDIDVIAEGIEVEAEFEVLYKMGIRKFQGYYFGRPGFERLPGHNAKAVSRQYKLI